jgi:mRNA interferase MazF
MNLDRGAVVVVRLDPTRGHEQRGRRPCVVVSDPQVGAEQKFPMICVVPISAVAGEGALYPALEPGESGLRKRSYGLVDQIRSVDKRRVEMVFGCVAREEMRAVDEGLALYLGLEPLDPRDRRFAARHERDLGQ